MLETIDNLRAEIEAGAVVAFVGVSIGPNDDIDAWVGTTKDVSNLRMLGAISGLEHWFYEGIEE